MKCKLIAIQADIAPQDSYLTRLARLGAKFCFSSGTKSAALKLMEAKPDFLNHNILDSDPNGFIMDVLPLSLYTVYYYRKLLHTTRPLEMLNHLRSLMKFIRDNHRYTMPLNTSRILVALIKEALKHDPDSAERMKYLEQFIQASEGDPRVIKKLLRLNNMIELPEGIALRNIGAAWDDRVHDISAGGRKETIQLILDAYMKGLSKVNLSYRNSLHPVEQIYYGLIAAEILEMDVTFSVEFKIGKAGDKTTFTVYFPVCKSLDDYYEFFEHEKLDKLYSVIQEHFKLHIASIHNHIDIFNKALHFSLVDATLKDAQTCLTPITFANAQDVSKEGYLDRIHLGIILYNIYKPILESRILKLRHEFKEAEDAWRKGELQHSQYKRLKNQLAEMEEKYGNLNPRQLRDQYFSHAIVDYDALFPDEYPLSAALNDINDLGGVIVISRPLEIGLQQTLQHIVENFPAIKAVELYNTLDCFGRKSNEIKKLHEMIEILNSKDFNRIYSLLNEYHIPSDTSDRFLLEFLKSELTIKFTVSSDSTGYYPEIPGMGFYDPTNSKISAKIHRRNIKGKISLPIKNTFNIKKDDIPCNYLFCDKIPFHITPAGLHSESIHSLGKEGQFKFNTLGEKPRFPYSYLLKYPRPLIKNSGLVAMGFLVALHHPVLAIGLPFTTLWFSITFLRNYISDMFSRAGTKIRDWGFNNFDINNACNSLFCTGFSIPLLKLVDMQVSGLLDSMDISIFTNKLLRFISLSTVNGAYIFSHNMIRNMGFPTARMNCLRTIISAPFATLGSYVLDPVLPKVVQSKFWGDTVAGFVVGLGKYRKLKKYRDDDYKKLFDSFSSTENFKEKSVNFLDILFIWARQPRGKSRLKDYLKKYSEADLRNLLEFSNQSQMFGIFDNNNLHPRYQNIKAYLQNKIPDFQVFCKKILDQKQAVLKISPGIYNEPW
ncbi:MAG: hypothetical protein PHV30_03105 [Candidatus Margulisbacteria bacterium]|nr:hypothetical protein [Candidatus Margulisiibacteriota bacterium]